MKQKINNMICRIFGHSQTIEEVYAQKLPYSDASNPLYNIVRNTVCLRCGKTVKYEILEYSITRKDMIRKKWFITE